MSKALVRKVSRASEQSSENPGKSITFRHLQQKKAFERAYEQRKARKEGIVKQQKWKGRQHEHEIKQAGEISLHRHSIKLYNTPLLNSVSSNPELMDLFFKLLQGGRGVLVGEILGEIPRVNL